MQALSPARPHPDPHSPPLSHTLRSESERLLECVESYNSRPDLPDHLLTMGKILQNAPTWDVTATQAAGGMGVTALTAVTAN